MARIALGQTFMDDLAKLDRPLQRKVRDLLAKFSREHRTAGLHLEPYRAAADPRARTARVDDKFRAILAAPETDDLYIVVRVLPHDQADRWMAKNTFSVNAVTGAFEVVPVRDAEPAQLPAPAADGASRPLAVRPERDFRQLGIVDPAVIAMARRAESEDEARLLASALPTDQGDALVGLWLGMDVDEIYRELLAVEAARPGARPAPDDLATAVTTEASRSSFIVVDDETELADVLSRDFEAWQHFLHPTQRAVVERDYSGAARITGGAGTGKTVALLHRARRLAESGRPEVRRVLVTTFTRNLESDLRARLRSLGGPELLDNVDVRSVDAFAFRVVTDAEGAPPRVLRGEEVGPLWEEVVDTHGFPFEPAFLHQEWEQVVLAHGIRSREQYFGASRAGRGVRLARRDRLRVWEAVEAFEAELARDGRRTFLQLAATAQGHLAAAEVKPYDHVLVDEAQDLHPAQWRMLRAAVPECANDVFVAGDAHQRIYDNRVTLSSLGIDTRGRSRRLRLSYRTTHEILRWSLELLTGETFDDLEGGEDTLAGYRSVTHGMAPVLEGAPSRPTELEALVAAVQHWTDVDDIPPEAVGVCARTNATVERVRQALDRAGLPVARDGRPTGVRVETMHGMKGLEFRTVAMVDVGAASVPPAVAVTPANQDPVRHQQDLQRERCLLYVAATRAREQLRVSWSGAPSSLLVDGAAQATAEPAQRPRPGRDGFGQLAP